MIKKALALYFTSWWRPSVLYICLLICFALTVTLRSSAFVYVSDAFFYAAGLAFAGIIVAFIWNLIKKRWRTGWLNALMLLACGAVTVPVLGLLMFATLFGPSEDGFADNLTIPPGIEIAEPVSELRASLLNDAAASPDEFQATVRQALAGAGGDNAEFAPGVPSLKKAATDHGKLFNDYLEASPDWHVFIEGGNRFAARRWSYGGEPRDELHGYISEFDESTQFQTRCLLCLDRKQWSRYSVEHVDEGKTPFTPTMRFENKLHESRVMIDCGGVWMEIFEQSNKPERRITKATLSALDKEFSQFLSNPATAIANARSKSGELAQRLAGTDGRPFQLQNGMQPGIYEVFYSLNPGEPGSVYLKAFEVTKGTPLSVDRLRMRSETRMTWSKNPAERFGGKAGFTIYEGDWGKPYAARFEVWFKPDSGSPDRKLAERNFKIEGWQR